jgi:hypothetical protein
MSLKYGQFPAKVTLGPLGTGDSQTGFMTSNLAVAIPREEKEHARV